MSESVVVAVDGSDGACRAVKWAADDAGRKGLPLRIVHVMSSWPYDISRAAPPEWPDAVAEEAGRLLGEAAEVASVRHPGIEVTRELLDGSPAKVLRDLATPTTEVVLGSRGLGGFTGALLGSVSTYVATHAHGPVVVVRPRDDLSEGAGQGERDEFDEFREVVVGIDGSQECEPAVGYAFEQARLRGAALRAVHAWQLPPYAFALQVGSTIDELQEGQNRVAAERLAAWREKFSDVMVVETAPLAHPVTALTEASQTADLLVVGSRGRGALESALLGSVSRAVLHHAHSPVAVVRS